MITEEELEMLDKIKEDINKIIEKRIEDAGYDRAYFQFNVDVYIWDVEFTDREKFTLIDERDIHICSFCGKPTYYYDTKLEKYLCPKCYGEIYGYTKMDKTTLDL